MSLRSEWPTEALEFQRTVRRALAARGGVALARAAEVDPAARSGTVGPLLDQLGVRTLDPVAREEDEAAAAALAVKEAGAVLLPWPLVAELSVPVASRAEIDGLYLGGEVGRLEHLDLLPRAVVLDDIEGSAVTATAGPLSPAPLDPFGCAVITGAPAPDLPRGAAVTSHLLSAFWITGALRTAVAHALRHAGEREQFGVQIGTFGEVRWRLADMIVARDGVEELARHTWWLVHAGRATTADVLALRVAALESATTVLGHAHQVLGAMGLCEEHDLAVVDRHLQPALRRPWGRAKTTRLLARAIAAEGFDAIFPVPAWAR